MSPDGSMIVGLRILRGGACGLQDVGEGDGGMAGEELVGLRMA